MEAETAEAEEGGSDNQLLMVEQEDHDGAEGFDLWQHFTKLDDLSENRAECNLCHRTYNYKTTTGNLKSHLARRHIDAFPYCEELLRRRDATPLKPRGPRTPNITWKFFRKLDNYMAECSFCLKQLSYKSTVHNIKLHLQKQHPEYAEQETDTSYEDVQYLDIANDDDSECSGQAPSDARVWRYFEKERDGRARCGLCETLVRARRLRHHLSDRHPGVMAALIAQGSDDEEEKPLARLVPNDPLGTSTVLIVKNRKRSKHHKAVQDESISSEEEETPSKNFKDQTQDSFLQYIGTLLQGTPHELHLQLQMDIISLIMKAKRQAYEKEAQNTQQQPQQVTYRVVVPKNAPVHDLGGNKPKAEIETASDHSKRQDRSYGVVFSERVSSTDCERSDTVNSLVPEAVGTDLPVQGDDNSRAVEVQSVEEIVESS